MGRKNTKFTGTIESPVAALNNIHWVRIKSGKCTDAKSAAMSGNVFVVKLDETTYATNAIVTPGCYMLGDWPFITDLGRCLMSLGVITKAEFEQHKQTVADRRKLMDARADVAELSRLMKKYDQSFRQVLRRAKIANSDGKNRKAQQ